MEKELSKELARHENSDFANCKDSTEIKVSAKASA